jgi:hypothetical protein
MEATYGIGGHGLLMAMSPSCRVKVTGEGELVILRRGREVARVVPGDVPAHAALAFITDGIAQFGEGGPTLELLPGVEPEALFAQIDHGLPSVEWSALAAGVMVALPVGVVLVPARPDDDDPFFELHALDGRDEFISFLPRDVAASEVVIHPAPYQRVLGEGTTKSDGRTIRYTECAYERDGARWRQIFFTVPVERNETVVVRAQATESNAASLFRAATATAKTLIPLA